MTNAHNFIQITAGTMQRPLVSEGASAQKKPDLTVRKIITHERWRSAARTGFA